MKQTVNKPTTNQPAAGWEKELKKRFVKRFYGFDEIEKRGAYSLDTKQVDEVWQFIIEEAIASTRSQTLAEVVRVAEGMKETDTKYGAIRCARCMGIPGMPKQPHCVDFVNQALADLIEAVKKMGGKDE